MNRLKSDKTQKEYKVSFVENKTTKNGTPYLKFQVSDAKLIDNNWEYKNFYVTTWQNDLKLSNGDKIVFEEVNGWDYGKSQSGKMWCSIDAVIKVTSQNPMPDSFDTIDDSGDNLPF